MPNGRPRPWPPAVFHRARRADDWHALLARSMPLAPCRRRRAIRRPRVFTAYLARCRRTMSRCRPCRRAASSCRAIMPARRFWPSRLSISPVTASKGSLGALMQRRYESYVATIVKPFFFGHFARLDRQIVLVDTLTALNAGAARREGSATGADADPHLLPTGSRTRCSPVSSAAASTAFSLPPPRPICCITPATTGSRIFSSSSSRTP